ncbi:MAG: hypothetical protein LIO67_05560 [Lachnospiraceae bacterium]|nr:hypothetical protein [Lachnospiraceae bacterium]
MKNRDQIGYAERQMIEVMMKLQMPVPYIARILYIDETQLCTELRRMPEGRKYTADAAQERQRDHAAGSDSN